MRPRKRKPQRQPLHRPARVSILYRLCWPVAKGHAKRVAQMANHLANGHPSPTSPAPGPDRRDSPHDFCFYLHIGQCLHCSMLLRARRRHNPIHPQILHHLSVMVECVRNAEPSKRSARRKPGSGVLITSNTLAGVSVAIALCANANEPASAATTSSFLVSVDSAFTSTSGFSPLQRAVEIVGLRHVRRLLRKRPHRCEFGLLPRHKDRLARSEIELVRRHRLHRAHHLALNKAQLRIERIRRSRNRPGRRPASPRYPPAPSRQVSSGPTNNTLPSSESALQSSEVKSRPS